MLRVQNVHKVYDTGTEQIPVLKGVDLTVEKGAFIAVVGPSGAGKSTLLHIAGGLDTPSRGMVLFEGNNLYGLSDAALCKTRNERIGFVFQFYHLLPEFTVLENVMMPALMRARPRAPEDAIMEDALMLLGSVGLSQRVAHFPSQLSGGEKQRVAIARALVNRPALLLCDEPTGNLDSATGFEIVRVLEELHRKEHMTIVMVTHNMEMAGKSERIYHLKDGMLSN